MRSIHWSRLCALALMSACAVVGEDYERPAIETQAAWASSAEDGVDETRSNALGTWWRALDDPELDRLVDEALAGSIDLATAVQRVRQSAALHERSIGERYPDVDGSGSYERSRTSGNTFPPFDQQTFDVFSLGAQFAWEIDVWGRVTRSIEAADADLGATVEDLRDVQALIVASVAATYVDVRSNQMRLEVARKNIEIQRRSLDLTRTRFDAGAAPALDVAQARTNLSNTESELPTIRAELRDAQLTLAVLLGLEPTALIERLEAEDGIPDAPDVVAAGVPADVLRDRADVRAAERRLAGEIARIGVEEGDLYPRFSLVGSIGYESMETDDLFESDSLFFGLGPSFDWNLFDGGRERADIEAQRAAAEIARLEYRQVVLEALQEVEQALFDLARQRERATALDRAVAAARESADLSRQLYLEGRSDFQNVLDAERTLFDAEESLIVTRASVTQSYVSLLRALGGGWQMDPEAAAGE